MTRDELTASLRKLSEDIFATWPIPLTVRSRGAVFAASLAIRSRSSYDSIVLLLDDGRHDESVVLYRRLLEDSLRATYLRMHPVQADGLAIRQEMDALTDAIRNLEAVVALHPRISLILDDRRTARSKLDQEIQETGVKPKKFPSPAVMAKQGGRLGDPLSYGAASYPSHSALSPMIDAYRLEHEQELVFGFKSGNLHERALLGRAAAQAFAHLMRDVCVFLDIPDVAATVARLWNPWHRDFINANNLATDVVSEG